MFAAFSMVITIEHLQSGYRYDLTSRSHNIGIIGLHCIFYLSFPFFSATIVKTDSLQCVCGKHNTKKKRTNIKKSIGTQPALQMYPLKLLLT